MKFKKNDLVKVKQGVKDPDWNTFDLSGWQGKIIKLSKPEPPEEEVLADIVWDSVTLKQMPQEYCDRSEEEGYELEEMTLSVGELEPASPREQEPVRSRYDEQNKRIAAIIGTDNLDVDKEKLLHYQDYLQQHLSQPCLLTGIEDFKWEEKYVFGYGSPKEYEALKKTRPSYTDTYTFLAFEEKVPVDGEHPFLLVKVRRKGDNRQFTLPLFELKATDPASPNFRLLDDYAMWVVNNY
ncbi:hypothetical protein BH24BAC1_BH24BAC1_28790 [soil metagenome]